MVYDSAVPSPAVASVASIASANNKASRPLETRKGKIIFSGMQMIARNGFAVAANAAISAVVVVPTIGFAPSAFASFRRGCYALSPDVVGL
jgi:hypothetical protein